MPIYSLFGLVADCDVTLSNAVEVHEARPDVVLRTTEDTAVPAGPPAGELLGEIRDADGTLAAATTRDVDGSVVVRLCRTAEFDLDLTTGRINYHCDPSTDRRLLSVFITGIVLATWLQMTGRDLLHASAVHVPAFDGVVAFVGSSGMGKSTVATLLADGNQTLFADDILRVDRADGGLVARRGTTQTRLRPKAASLGEQVPGAHATADGRLAVPLPACPDPSHRLVAVVVPGPDPEAEKVSLTRITGAGALFALMAHPRLVGWQRQAEHTRQFQFLSDLVQQVPVFSSRLPWGPPFAPDLGDELRAELRNHIG